MEFGEKLVFSCGRVIYYGNSIFSSKQILKEIGKKYMKNVFICYQKRMQNNTKC
jgi:hypothetical protein